MPPRPHRQQYLIASLKPRLRDAVGAVFVRLAPTLGILKVCAGVMGRGMRRVYPPHPTSGSVSSRVRSFFAEFLGNRLNNGSPYAIGPLSCLSVLSVMSVCNVGVLWLNGWMYQDKTRYRGRPRPRPYCARWEPSHPPKGAQQLPNFRHMSVVAKRLDGSRCHLVRR